MRRSRRKRGVSDVVATIILLAMTVTLFSAIFAFVTTFPRPPAQNSNQFQATLVYGGTSGSPVVVGVNITHLAGPSVPSTASVYLKSALHPTQCPFTGAVPVSQGIGSTAWSLGQVWVGNFASFPACGGTYAGDSLSDNITVYIINQNNMIFTVVLPGQGIGTPPAITSVRYSPDPLATGTQFWVNATIVGSVKPNSVYLNLGSAPGFPAPVKMTYFASSGTWSYAGSGIAQSGIYSGFINATGTSGQTTASGLTITVVSAGGMFASIAATPTSGQTPLSVSFSATVGGANGTLSFQWMFGDGSPSVTSPNPWTSHTYTTLGSFLASVVVTDSSGHQATASVTISVTPPDLVYGVTTANNHNVAYGCVYSYSGWNCPNIFYRVWNNGSFSVIIQGTEYANGSSSGNVATDSVGPMTLTAGQSTGQMTAFSGFQPSQTDTYTFTLILTVTQQSTGAFVGYIHQTVTVSITG